ncbi:hypothetical protein [Reyranella sp.]|uniref:hypothetical protein n=1 Tax=Reyranella sp. TaxID=1929291 RepID=UPI003BA97333
MLKKMLIQGLAAAAVIAVAAAVHAQVQTGAPAQGEPQAGVAVPGGAAARDDGYLAAPARDGRLDRDGRHGARRDDRRPGGTDERGARDLARFGSHGGDHDGDDD